MSETLLSSRNLAFELYEVLDAEGLTRRERFAEHNRETFDAAIGTARSIAEKYFAPHNRKGDENEPRYEDGKAILIPEVKPAVDAFLEAGFQRREKFRGWRHATSYTVVASVLRALPVGQRCVDLVPVPDHGRGESDRKLRHR